MISECMKSLSVIVSLALLPSALLSGQAQRWTVSAELQAGVLTPTRDLGVDGVTQARIRSGPALGASLRFRPLRSPLGLYLETVQALQGGFRAWPTNACQIRCQEQTSDHGRFWTLTGGATVQGRLGPIHSTARLGGGLRSYSLYGADITANVPQPGEFWTARFLGASTNAALHAGLHIAMPVGRPQIFLSIEDLVAGSDYRRTFNDLVISGGIHLP